MFVERPRIACHAIGEELREALVRRRPRIERHPNVAVKLEDGAEKGGALVSDFRRFPRRHSIGARNGRLGVERRRDPQAGGHGQNDALHTKILQECLTAGEHT